MRSAALLLLTCGCAADTTCKGIDDPDGLWTRAAAVRIDVYGATTQCDGSQVAAGGGAPQLSRLFDAHQVITVDVPVGEHAIALTLYSDSAGTMMLGSACVAEMFRADTCLHLSLTAASPGECLSDADCASDAGARICCGQRCVDPSNDVQHCGGCATACGAVHTVAECRSGSCATDCMPGWAHCTSEGGGCETNLAEAGLKLCGDRCLAAASCCADADCAFPPGPAACFVPACVGGDCHYPMLPGAQLCAGTCCAPLHALCGSDCGLQCATGWSDCDGATADGCECEGAGCCSGGCLVKHDNGVGQSFFDCTPLGTFDQAQATAACAAFTGDATQCHPIGCTGNNQAVCSDGSAAACDCWVYSGVNRGDVKHNATGACSCRNGTSSSWS